MHSWVLSLASQDALEVMGVTDSLSVSTDLTDVTLVSDDTVFTDVSQKDKEVKKMKKSLMIVKTSLKKFFMMVENSLKKLLMMTSLKKLLMLMKTSLKKLLIMVTTSLKKVLIMVKISLKKSLMMVKIFFEEKFDDGKDIVEKYMTI